MCIWVAGSDRLAGLDRQPPSGPPWALGPSLGRAGRDATADSALPREGGVAAQTAARAAMVRHRAERAISRGPDGSDDSDDSGLKNRQLRQPEEPEPATPTRRALRPGPPRPGTIGLPSGA